MKLVTTNNGKYKEIKKMAQNFGLEITQLSLDVPEIRGNIKDIVKEKAKEAYGIAKKSVICDDSGLFIKALHGFPGEFSRFVLGKIGTKGILRLMRSVKRDAEFRCAVCFYDGKRFVTELGVVKGEITYEERGNKGFGFDPIFLPEGHDLTFGEDFEYKMKVSHRRRAFEKIFKRLS